MTSIKSTSSIKRFEVFLANIKADIIEPRKRQIDGKISALRRLDEDSDMETCKKIMELYSEKDLVVGLEKAMYGYFNKEHASVLREQSK